MYFAYGEQALSYLRKKDKRDKKELPHSVVQQFF